MNKSQNWDKALQAPNRHRAVRHKPPATHLRRWGPAYKGGGSPVPTDASACGVKLDVKPYVDGIDGVTCGACKLSVFYQKLQRRARKEANGR